jgi:hypothetical protein
MNINEVELASELATKSVLSQYLGESNGCEHEDVEGVYTEDSDGTIRFTEDAQDSFNYWYAYYLDIIEGCSIG